MNKNKNLYNKINFELNEKRKNEKREKDELTAKEKEMKYLEDIDAMNKTINNLIEEKEKQLEIFSDTKSKELKELLEKCEKDKTIHEENEKKLIEDKNKIELEYNDFKIQISDKERMIENLNEIINISQEENKNLKEELLIIKQNLKEKNDLKKKEKKEEDEEKEEKSKMKNEIESLSKIIRKIYMKYKIMVKIKKLKRI